VINASWRSYDERASEPLREVIAAAGLPVVVAAGNEGHDPSAFPGQPIAYPAGYGLPNVLAVTAIDHRGAVPDFANTDRVRVHLAAPGVHIVTTELGGGHTGAFGLQGTSYAVPHVSATLGLARSAAPYATTPELIDAVVRTTRVLP